MPRTVSLFLVNTALVFTVMLVFGLRINISNSFPVGVYKRHPLTVERFALVESCLPEAISRLMVNRQYIPDRGDCGGYPPLIKKIFAVEGDVIRVAHTVAINGNEIANTSVMSADADLRPLVSADSTTVASDHVWLMSDHHRQSFDARYFGQTHISLLRGGLEPVWTFE